MKKMKLEYVVIVILIFLSVLVTVSIYYIDQNNETIQCTVNEVVEDSTELRDLTDLEIEMFNYRLSLTGIENNIGSLFMYYFESPEELDVYNYIIYSLTSEEVSDEEYELLRENDLLILGDEGEMVADTTKVYLSSLNFVLNTYFGISYEDISEEFKIDNYYLEEYDSFYGQVSDVGGATFVASSGTITDEEIILYGENLLGEKEVITLVKSDGSYYFYSYMPQ